jgi:hypothetical protein
VSGGSETAMSAQAAVTVLKVTPAEGQYVPDFGPNVFVVDQSMNITDIQTVCDNIYSKQQANIPSGSPGSSEFTTNRYALLFKPGTYTDPNDINVGFYTQVAGLGTNPDDVTINGGVARNADWMGQNATDNFWSSVSNMAINPTVDGGKMYWAVSQAAPLRRVHVKGDLWLFKWGNSSGGFLGDSKIDGTVESGSQQQWRSRNDTWNAWSDGVWNMMFVGDANTTPPAAGSTLSGTWPATTATQVAKTPVEREEPFLTYNNTSGNYNIFVPSLEKGTTGVDWPNTVGTSVPVDGTHVYIAHPDTDTAETINAQLNDGKDLILTPGIYHIDEAIDVKNANTVVLGLGFATLIPTAGNAAITVADVDGVSVSGLIIDAGTVDSPVLLQVGPTTSTTDHSADPTLISDVYFRVGGATAGTADSCFVVNSNNVIGDNLWVTNPTSTGGSTGGGGSAGGGGSSTPVPTKITGTAGTDGSTSAQITPTQTNSSTVSNVTVALGSVTVTAPSSVFNSALGSSGTSTLSLAQTSTSTATQTAVNAAAASKGIIPVSTLDIDLTNVSSSGALVPVHQLNGNITVTIALTDAQIAKITDASKARLYYFDPDTNALTDMNATFDLTAKTVTFTTNHFSTYVIANTTSTSTTTTPTNNIGVTYSAQVQHIGWQSFVSDGAQAGTTGKALRLEGVKINLTGNVPQGAKITYQAQVQKLGWMSAVSNGALAGTVGKALRLEALKITLSGMSGYEVEYRAQVQGAGWQKWQVSKNGTSIASAAIAGTTGKGLRLEAIEIKIVKIS